MLVSKVLDSCALVIYLTGRLHVTEGTWPGAKVIVASVGACRSWAFPRPCFLLLPRMMPCPNFFLVLGIFFGFSASALVLKDKESELMVSITSFALLIKKRAAPRVPL